MFKKTFYKIILISFILKTFFALAQTSSWPQLEKLENNGLKVSAMVVRLHDAKIIAELNPDQRLSPASVSKLVVASSALNTWGPDKTFITKVYMRGELIKNTLQGDIIFYGAGDPSLTNEKLWFLSTDVARFGIKKITGKIIVNNSLYGKILEDENRIRGKEKSRNAYDSPLSSSAINFSVLALVVNPGEKLNSPAKISIEPYKISSIKINNLVTTSNSNSITKINVYRSSHNGQDTFNISGNIAHKSSTQRIYRSISDPDRYTGETFNAFLKSAGIETSGLIQVESTPLNRNESVIAQVEGFPLDWQLKGLFQVSNNFIADMLTLSLTQEQYSINNIKNLKNGGKFLEKYLENLIKNSHWKSTKNINTPLVLESGSGLTPNSRLSARDIISVLDQMYFNGRAFPAYLAGLPIAGEEGTLKKRFLTSSEKHLQERLRAKTGTLTDPIFVSSLGGYSRLLNGDWVAFAIIVNGLKSKTQFDLKNIRDAIDSDLAKVLPMEL